MKIGVIGSSKVEFLEEVNTKCKELIKKLAEKIKDNELIVTPDKGSVGEFFAKEYIKAGGKKIHIVVPLNDSEFGNSWVNKDLGEVINCGTWRNQPEKLNEETEVILCLGYAVGVLAEIAYSKWFNRKRIYIIKELISEELPKEAVRGLDIKYVRIDEFNLD